MVLQTTKWIAIWSTVLAALTATAFARGQAAAAEPVAKLVERGALAALRARLASGADPNEPDNSVVKGWTPLMAAAHSGNVSAARILLEFGAEINAQTEFGSTALDVAERSACSTCSTRDGNLQVAELLRSRGAKGAASPAAPARTAATPGQTPQARTAATPVQTPQARTAATPVQAPPAANASAVRKPFTKSEIGELLKLETPDALLMPQIRAAGVDFVATPADLADLAKLGASNALVAVVRDASNLLAARKAAEAEEAAKKEAETLFWNDVEKSPDSPALESYLRHFPNGPHATPARQRLDEMARETRALEDIIRANIRRQQQAAAAARPKQPAILVVYNIGRSSGNYTLFVDGRPIVKLASGRFARLKVEPGTRRLQIGSSPTAELEIREGQTIDLPVMGDKASKARVLVESIPRTQQLIQRRRMQPAGPKDILDRNVVMDINSRPSAQAVVSGSTQPATLVVYNIEVSFGRSTFFVDGRAIVKLGSFRYAKIRVAPGVRHLQLNSLKSPVVDLELRPGQTIELPIRGGLTPNPAILINEIPNAQQLIPRGQVKPAGKKDILAGDVVMK